MKLCYPLNLPFNISQKWGENPTYYAQLGLNGHNGWDFSCPVGTPVYATHDGTVFFVGEMSDMAKQVTINTPEKDYRTFYAHLSEFKVTPGQVVKRGQLIGFSGNTGRYTTGPHLHFGIHPMKDYLDLDHNNGFGGAIDPASMWDGTYPNSTVTTQPMPIPALPEHFLNFQSALDSFQRKENLIPYPLVGPGTKRALNKYLKDIKY